MELIASDFRTATEMFAVLDQAAKVEGIREVTIIYKNDGYETVTVTYGEAAEPAIVSVEDAPPSKPENGLKALPEPSTQRGENGFTTTCLVRITVPDPNSGSCGRYHTVENVTEWLRGLVEQAPPLGVQVRVIRDF